MAIALSDASVVINNALFGIVPNTISFTEGKGEQNVRVASGGGGAVSLVYSRNVETNYSNLKFELYNVPDVINAVRAIKSNLNQNTISVSGQTPDGKLFTRTFKESALTADYEVTLGADTTIALEFMTAAAV